MNIRMIFAAKSTHGFAFPVMPGEGQKHKVAARDTSRHLRLEQNIEVQPAPDVSQAAS